MQFLRAMMLVCKSAARALCQTTIALSVVRVNLDASWSDTFLVISPTGQRLAAAPFAQEAAASFKVPAVWQERTIAPVHSCALAMYRGHDATVVNKRGDAATLELQVGVHGTFAFVSANVRMCIARSRS